MISRFIRALKYLKLARFPVRKSELNQAKQLLIDVSDYKDSIRANSGVALDYLFGDSEESHLYNLEGSGMTLMQPLISQSVLEGLREDLLSIELAAKEESNVSTPMHRVEFRKGSQETTSLIGSERAICVTREGDDFGMVDVFNLPIVSESARTYQEKVLDSGIIQLLEKAAGSKMKFSNMNAYINRDVTNTRGLHVDSYGVNQFKFFTYLTDVDELADGPYCYGVGSHALPGLREINRFVNDVLGSDSTDIRIIPRHNLVPVLAKAGTSILSNQSAAHGGFPQAPGHFRMLAVMNFVSA